MCGVGLLGLCWTDFWRYWVLWVSWDDAGLILAVLSVFGC